MKRLFDIACSISILSITAPLLIIVVILITLESSEPALYRSRRIGRKGRSFGMLRLRTMEDLYDPADAVSERVETRVGHVIRNYSIDDLPNLWNVLRGEMSIVGPRAIEPHLVDLANPEWHAILSVKPGWLGNAVLCLGSSFNASSPALKQKLELEYVERQSLAYDLRLVGRTVWMHVASGGNIKARGKPLVYVEGDRATGGRPTRGCT